MAIEQDFLPYAVGGSANVLSQSAYAALTALLQNGLTSGIVPSNELNKILRQPSIIASVVAQFIVAQTGQPAIDDGTTATLLANLATAISVSARQNPVLTDTGTANAYAVANLSAFTAYPTASGLTIDVSILNANTGASTLNVDGLGAKPILGLGLQPLQGGELIVKGVACLMYIVASTVNSGNGAWILMECAGGAQQVAPATASAHAVQFGQMIFGQCRLSVASTTSLVLKPYAGNNVTVNGTQLVLPSAGVSATNGGLAASTLYYVYLAGTTASPVLNLSTTGHVTATNGVEVKSGDATQTLVGMISTNASSQFVDSGTFSGCANWFNRRNKFIGTTFGPNTTTSTSTVELNTTNRLSFLSWSDESIRSAFTGNATNTVGSGAGCITQVSLDGTQFGANYVSPSPIASTGVGFNTEMCITPSEGLHYTTLFGAVATSGTGSFQGTSSLTVRG